MSDFDGIEDVSSTQSGNYVEPGNYPVLFINSLKTKKSQKNGDKLFIAELDIIESKVESRPAGSSMAWIVNLTKHGKTALGNVKGLLAAALATDEKNVTSAMADKAVSIENPFHARLVRCEAVQITTNAGNPFTKSNWHPIGDELQKEAVALHQQAGFAPF